MPVRCSVLCRRNSVRLCSAIYFRGYQRHIGACFSVCILPEFSLAWDACFSSAAQPERSVFRCCQTLSSVADHFAVGEKKEAPAGKASSVSVMVQMSAAETQPAPVLFLLRYAVYPADQCRSCQEYTSMASILELGPSSNMKSSLKPSIV